MKQTIVLNKKKSLGKVETSKGDVVIKTKTSPAKEEQYDNGRGGRITVHRVKG